MYDSTGQRVRKVTENYAAENETPTRESERIYLGGFEIDREYANGVVETERESLHVMDDPSAGSGQAKQRIALVETKTIDEGNVVENLDPLIRFQLTNHLGSSCVEVDETGSVISFEEYYPFGGTSFHSATTAIPKRYRYTGKERDDETGLYYYGARYYASWLGRWTAADPIGIKDGPNVFAYVRNNPVRMTDLSGTEALGSIAPKGTYNQEKFTTDIGDSRDVNEYTMGPLAWTGPEESAIDPSNAAASVHGSEGTTAGTSPGSESRSSNGRLATMKRGSARSANDAPSYSRKQPKYVHKPLGMPEVEVETITPQFEQGPFARAFSHLLEKAKDPKNSKWTRFGAAYAAGALFPAVLQEEAAR